METSFEAIERAHSHMARKRVLEDVKTLARDAEDLLKATAGDLTHSLRHAGSRYKAAYQEIEKSSLIKGKVVVTWAGKVVRQYPYPCAALGFGLGLLTGLLMPRK